MAEVVPGCGQDFFLACEGAPWCQSMWYILHDQLPSNNAQIISLDVLCRNFKSKPHLGYSRCIAWLSGMRRKKTLGDISTRYTQLLHTALTDTHKQLSCKQSCSTFFLTIIIRSLCRSDSARALDLLDLLETPPAPLPASPQLVRVSAMRHSCVVLYRFSRG